MRPRKRLSFLAVAAAIAAGCATTPPVGGRDWHAARLQEIQQAYETGEITTEEYLSLKNEADAIRQAYQEELRDRAYYHQHYDPFGFPFHGHPAFH